jgi:hypothetical protein
LGTGMLTGKWFDGTSWATSINTNDSGATIRAVPEPSTFILLGMGAVGLLAFAWRRRKRADADYSAPQSLFVPARGAARIRAFRHRPISWLEIRTCAR